VTRSSLLALLACCTQQPSLAEDPGTLQSRLEQIETQNEQLRQELSDLRERDELLATQISSSRVIAEGEQAAKIQKHFLQNGTTASKPPQKTNVSNITSEVAYSLIRSSLPVIHRPSMAQDHSRTRTPSASVGLDCELTAPCTKPSTGVQNSTLSIP
jgi:hypothetical protein